jgi:hypothetical protein
MLSRSAGRVLTNAAVRQLEPDDIRAAPALQHSCAGLVFGWGEEWIEAEKDFNMVVIDPEPEFAI